MSSNPEMQASPARVKCLVDNFSHVVSRVQALAIAERPVQIVAVSKLKPASDILALYSNVSSNLHFGENYTQELMEKAQLLPRDVNWHFIGQLQTNKCKMLAEKIPNLWAVQSVDNEKKANALEKGRAVLIASSPEVAKLRVFVQVNTSGEEEKAGCKPNQTLTLARHIIDNCPHLRLIGLMTIGAIARSKVSDIPNEDFILLKETRDLVAGELGMDLELSMGMSSDFEQAVKLGATVVRVGTTIFGERPLKKDAEVKSSAAEPTGLAVQS